MNALSCRPVVLRAFASGVAFTLAFAAALLPLPAAQAAATDCPAIKPSTQVAAGDVGEGHTVTSGGDPVPFNVEVLGVLSDAILPGRNLVVVDTSPPGNPSPVIDAAGGVWFGMSGSPVYASTGELIGAVAWGMSWGPSSIVGLTAAEDLDGLFDLAGTSTGSTPDAVALRGSTAQRVRQRDGRSSGADARMVPLRTPLAVSGLGNRRTGAVGETFDRLGASVLPYTTSAAPRPAAATGTPQAGGNFVAALSYGDVTFAATGTTTMVCDDEAVAFGHPFLWEGETQMGANDANALAIVDDPLSGPYKLAQLTDAFGTVDQDRFAGIRAALGPLPPLTPVVSRAADVPSGRSRTGTTDVVRQSVLPFITAFSLLGNADTTSDRIGPGSMALEWTVAGTRADGSAWSYDRGNRYISPFDISFESIWELLFQLDAVVTNPFEDVTVTGVDIDASIEHVVRRYDIVGIAVSVDGGPFLDAPDLVEPGSHLMVRVTLSPRDGTAERTVDLAVTVPDDASGFAFLEVTSGLEGEDCLFPEDCPSDVSADSFDDLLDTLANAPRNDEVVARLFADPGFDEPFPEAPDDGGWYAVLDDDPTRDRTRVDRVVQGFAGLELVVAGDEGPPVDPTEPFARFAGDTRIGTAIALSVATFPEEGMTDTVVLARSTRYPDALAGGPLARLLEAPLLLTPSSGLDPAVAAEIGRLGASRAVLLGGPAALSPQVAADAETAGITEITRLGGQTRFETAALVAEEVGGDGAYLVQGSSPDPTRGWPDAVSAGALAAMEGHPILLTEAGSLPAATAASLVGRDRVTVVGGPQAVSASVADDVTALGAVVDRLGGATRYETSVLVAARAVERGATAGRAWFATGRDFADALAAGPAVAADGGDLVLVDGQGLSGSPPARGWLDEIGDDVEHVRLVGGPMAISLAVEQEVRAALLPE